MSVQIDERIAALGLVLPQPPASVGTYRPWAISGSLLFISGQLPARPDGELMTGCLGRDLSIDDGRAAARLCALSLIAQMKGALDDLERVTRIVRIGGFVCATQGFTAIADVMNGCSDLMVAVFGDQIGAHARAAVACTALPLGAAVETDAIVEFA